MGVKLTAGHVNIKPLYDIFEGSPLQRRPIAARPVLEQHLKDLALYGFDQKGRIAAGETHHSSRALYLSRPDHVYLPTSEAIIVGPSISSQPSCPPGQVWACRAKRGGGAEEGGLSGAAAMHRVGMLE